MALYALSGESIELPARLDRMEQVRRPFGRFLANMGVAREEAGLWEVVASEALTNAVRHGSQEDRARMIRAEWGSVGRWIYFAVEDSGQGPPPDRGGSTLPADPLAAGGRGLYLIDHFCDEVEEWRGSAGYRLVLKRRVPGETGMLMAPDLRQALDEINLCYESLAAFYKLGSALLATRSVPLFVSEALASLGQLLGAEKLACDFDQNLEPSLLRELHGLPERLPLMQRSARLSQSIRLGETVLWDEPADVRSDSYLKGFAMGCACPIGAAGSRMGALLVSRPANGVTFRTGETQAIRTFADVLGMAVAHANSQIRRAREAEALNEVRLAAQLQRDLLPPTALPRSEAWTVSVHRANAKEIAGDIVEAIQLPDGTLYLTIADVVGKGVPAAFLAAIYRTAFFNALETCDSLETMISVINRNFCRDVGRLSLFATVIIVRLPPSGEFFEIANAGHVPALLMNHERILSEVGAGAPPIGLFREETFPVQRVPIREAESLLLTTDGVYEWLSGEEMWGWPRFREFVEKQLPLEPETFWESLEALIERQAPAVGPGDDRTMVFWQRRTKEE